MMNRLVTTGIAFAMALVVLQWRSAGAIPAFARKYQTSCMTCHVAPPKLNAFGEAFRLNGYQIPEDEEELSKDEAAKLGSEGWKRVWPRGVWPGEIPGTPPLAVQVESEFKYDRESEINTEFERPSITLFLSGAMDEDISVYTGFHLFEEGEFGSLGRVFMQFSSLLSGWKLPKYALNIRFGQFIPEAVPFANHRGLTVTPYVTNLYAPSMGASLPAGHAHGGGDEFAFESNQLGLEMRGILRHRLRYATGLVNGSVDGSENNDAKDGYFRLAYKVGGMGFDGSGGGGMEAATSLVDNAVTFGTFGYLGALNNPESVGPEDLKVRRLGGDVNLAYKNLNLFGVYMVGRDRTMVGSGARDLDFIAWYTEVDYSFYPWLIGVVRYETADADGSESRKRVVPHLTMLVRPNIHIVLETALDPDNADFNTLLAELDFAF